MTLIEALADEPEKFSGMAALCRQERCDAVVVLLDPVLQNYRKEVVAIAASLGVPAAYPMLSYTEDGGLIAYSSDVHLLVRRAAAYVDKILKGAQPQDLPVEQPTTFELVVNRKTARSLGLAIPQSVLLRATRIVD